MQLSTPVPCAASRLSCVRVTRWPRAFYLHFRVCVCVCVCINAMLKDTIWVFHMQHFFIKMSKQFVLYVLVSCVLKSSSPEKAYLTVSSAYRQIQDDKNVLSPNLCRTELNFDNQSSAAAVTYSSRLWSLGKGLKKKKKPPLSHAPEG